MGMKPANSAAAEPVAPVDRLCSLTAMIILLCEINILFSAADIDHGDAGHRALLQELFWPHARRDAHPSRRGRSWSQKRHRCVGAGSSSTPTCVIASPSMSRTISSTAPKRVRSPTAGLPANLL